MTEEGIGADPAEGAAGLATMQEALARARLAQEAWAILPIEERCERVRALRDALVAHAEAVVDVIVAETGRPRIEALAHEVFVVADLASYYTRRARRILAPVEYEHRLLKHRRGYVHLAPRGVVAVLAPAVHVLSVPLGDALTALVAGNAVVVAPAPGQGATIALAKQLFDEAGLPADVLQIVSDTPASRMSLIAAGPDLVVFAGLPAEGRRVAAACGEHLVPSTLQLGGLGAGIVCADADLERAARALVFGAFASGGRSLIAVERAYAHVSVYEALVDRVSQLAVEVRVGDARRSPVDVGTVGDERSVERLEALVADAVTHGARVRVGGTRGEGRGMFLPTVLEGCAPDMRVMTTRREGPLLPIMRVANEEDAVAAVNASGAGLVGHVFTKDRERGRRLAEQLRVGCVMVNDVFTAYATPETPFGGVRQGGWGRVHGDQGLRAMCEARLVTYDRFPLGTRDPLWFPYGEGAYQAVSKALRLLYRRGSAVKKLLDLF